MPDENRNERMNESEMKNNARKDFWRTLVTTNEIIERPTAATRPPRRRDEYHFEGTTVAATTEPTPTVDSSLLLLVFAENSVSTAAAGQPDRVRQLAAAIREKRPRRVAIQLLQDGESLQPLAGNSRT
ncbi:hypothetical protein RB195_020109 [Necator americanus]|uniref:Uncharacterized protein n=1 Tax=Necator americanus TaxID=51031 RepID=A0ABR1CK29_NECAM